MAKQTAVMRIVKALAGLQKDEFMDLHLFMLSIVSRIKRDEQFDIESEFKKRQIFLDIGKK
jgi:hypothetical protein